MENYRITELFDHTSIKNVMDSFHALTGISVSIVDLDGNILFSSQRPLLCEHFYDTGLEDRNGCRLVRALNQNNALMDKHQGMLICPNGLLDAIQPLVVNGQRIGALLVGQVFVEQPDLQFYRQKAEQNGFDPDQFLDEIQKVPIINRLMFDKAVIHISSLTNMLADQAASRLKLEKSEQTLMRSQKLKNRLFLAS